MTSAVCFAFSRACMNACNVPCADYLSAELEIRSAGNEKADLRTRIKMQPLSSQDLKRLAVERQKMDDALENLLARKSQAQLNMDGLQLEFTRAVSALESNISEYRTLCTKLQLLPRGAKNAEGMDFELMLGTSTRAEELAVLPISSTIFPLAVRQLELFGERLRATMNEHQLTEEDIIKGEQQVAAKEAELSHVRDRITQIDNAIALAKGSRETDCKDIIGRVEMMEAATEQLRKDALARWQLAQAELDAAKSRWVAFAHCVFALMFVHLSKHLKFFSFQLARNADTSRSRA